MVANGFEGVPWMVGGGAKHSANLGRMVAYAALGGQEGVLGPGDLKVSATPGTADGFVHMTTGGIAILNRSAGAFQEMYIDRAPLVSDIPIASTGSTGRSDLIVARVEDQEYPPWNSAKYTDEAQIENGPYIFPRVISGVANTITRADQLGGIYANHSMYAVARIDIPPHTTNIDSTMIKDLRRLARPRTTSDLYTTQGPSTLEYFAPNQPWTTWPMSVSRKVTVPDWATHAVVGITTQLSTSGHVWGGMRVLFDTMTGTDSPIDINNDAPNVGDGEMFPLITYAEFDVRALQGKLVTVRTQTFRYDEPGVMGIAPWCQITYDIRFYERTV